MRRRGPSFNLAIETKWGEVPFIEVTHHTIENINPPNTCTIRVLEAGRLWQGSQRFGPVVELELQVFLYSCQTATTA